MNMWARRHLPSLVYKKVALETFVLSKLWHLARILSLPTPVANKLAAAAGSFLWRGSIEWLAWSELHCSRQEGGLGLTCIKTRSQTLLAKQVC
jgi:hypothetical protein